MDLNVRRMLCEEGVRLRKGVFHLIAATGMFVLLVGCSSLSRGIAPEYGVPVIVEKGVIGHDTVWEREILVKGDVEVPKGVTLTVMPGTVVKFAKIAEFGPSKLYNDKNTYFPRAELLIRGKLLAQGTNERMIVFTSAEKSPHAADWGAVNFLDTQDNVLEYCEISYANTAVHCHGGQVVVANCYLHDNGVAIGQKNVEGSATKCVVPILYSRISGNGGGILFGKGTSPTIAHNQISDNEFFGIFGKGGAPCHVRYNDVTHNKNGVIVYAMDGLRLSENNISENEEHNISLLEGQALNVDARHNWWGVMDEERIKALIWDKDEDASLGKLDFSDFALSPIEGAGIPW